MLEKFLMNGKENMGYRIKLVDQFLDEFEEYVTIFLTS